MKDKLGCLFRRGGWILIAGLLLISLLSAGCSKQSANSKVIKIDNLDTASGVTLINGQHWQTYNQQKIFPEGYSGEFWVVFECSNILHNNNINIEIDTYIESGGILEEKSSQNENQTDATDDTLYWGKQFDISKYRSKYYTVIVTITDLISAKLATMTNTFAIGSYENEINLCNCPSRINVLINSS
jgi:hypothetical protein